jgi:hypothetical protein
MQSGVTPLRCSSSIATFGASVGSRRSVSGKSRETQTPSTIKPAVFIVFHLYI